MLKDKIVFITGASSGIGAKTAEAFAKAGAKLLLCARRKEGLAHIESALKTNFSSTIHSFALDVRDVDAVNQALSTLPEEWKNIDILINNAGLAAGLDPIQTGNLDDWNAMIDTNVKGLLHVTRAVLPQMIQRNNGYIINIGSIAGHEVYPKGAVYCASKFAVNAISKGLRLDLSGTNIRITTIDPGAVETNFSTVRFKGDAERAKSVYKGFEPLHPEDIADAILYCASRPLHMNISEMIIMPTAQASATTIHRST